MFFHFDFKKVLLLLGLLTLPVLLFNFESSLVKLSSPFTEATHAIQSGLDYLSNGIGKTTSKYLDLISVKNLNKELLKEVSKLKMEQVFYQELLLENKRLKKMLAFRSKNSMRLEPALRTAEDILSDSHTLTLNRGSLKKVKKRMGVLGLNGIVGETLRVSRNRSVVITVLNRFFSIEGIIQRSRQKVLLDGSGDFYLLANHLDKNIDIQTGDLIVTSGRTGLFPKGLPIGLVKNVQAKPSEITKNAVVQPIADLYNTEEFFIVLSPNDESPHLETGASLQSQNEKKIDQ